MSTRDLTDREKTASVALHRHGLVLFPRDTAGLAVPPLYVLISLNSTGRPHEGRRFGSIDEIEAFVATLDAAGQPIMMQGKQVRTTPYVGQMVHYRSLGSAGGEYSSVCRAAVVTDVPALLSEQPNDGTSVSLCVLNPEGQFFNQGVRYHDGRGEPGNPDCPMRGQHDSGPFRYCACGWTEDHFTAGTWHFIPEAA